MSWLRVQWTWFFLYAAVGVVLLWPGVASPWDSVPGGMRTDLWNGLWSLDFQRDALLSLDAPWRVDVLGFPNGGNLPPVDPLAMLFFVPAGLLGTAFAYNLLIVFRLALGGLIAQGFAQEFCEAHGVKGAHAKRAAVFAGIATAGAPVLMAGVHNGTSEAANACGLMFSVWMAWRFGREPNASNGKRVALGLLWAALTSWYVAVLAFAHAGLVVLFHGRSESFFKRCMPVFLGLLFVLPWAVSVIVLLQVGDSNLSAHAFGGGVSAAPPDNFGAANWGAWFGLSGQRDIAILAPFEAGEGFFHCTAVAWTLLLLSFWGFKRIARKEAALVGLLLLSFVFSMGASVSIGGATVPMPYGQFLTLPGFSQLSLPFRFGIGVLPVLAVFGALGLSSCGKRVVAVACGLVVLQLRFFSPASGGVPRTDLSGIHQSQALLALADSPEGAVLHFPIWSQHPSLYAQRMHGKPITIAFDWASTETDLAFWETAREAKGQSQIETVGLSAKQLGIRYLLVDKSDPRTRADAHYEIFRAIQSHYTPLAVKEDSSELEVYALW